MSIRRQPRDRSLQNPLEIKVEKLLTPLENFIHKQTSAAVLLALAILTALFLANSGWNSAMQDITAVEAGLVFHRWLFLLPLKEWVGSGLMTLFFFLIGLEIKRETLAGKLRNPQQISLIVMAALGGMIFPALIYYAVNHGTAGGHGWAIPMATDTAFSLGVLSLLTRKVSYGVSIFLAAMAIFDDIGAIAVISLFYTQELHTGALAAAVLALALLFFVNLAGMRNGWVYAVLGIVLWGCIYNSGVHATLAGLLMAVTVPARTRLGETDFVQEARALLSIFERGQGADKGILGAPEQHLLAADIEATVKAASTPLQRWETFLVGPIGIVVLPVFALFNAGITLSGHAFSAAMSSPVTLGIMSGLIIGKPFGVSLLVFTGQYLKIGKLPEGMNFTEVIGVGMLAGIGFTMSLFITTLSFDHQPDLQSLVDEAKTGILISSLVSTSVACVWISLNHKFTMRKVHRKS